MSEFDRLWHRLLVEATPEAIRRAQVALQAMTADPLDVYFELSVFTDEDPPWLPSVWLTPDGPDQAAAAKAGGEARCLLLFAYGDDGEIHLNGGDAAIPELLHVDEPEDARRRIGDIVTSWIDELWRRNFRVEATAVRMDDC